MMRCVLSQLVSTPLVPLQHALFGSSFAHRCCHCQELLLRVGLWGNVTTAAMRLMTLLVGSGEAGQDVPRALA